MKVLIITRHAIANYGSVLQAYATQKIFENLGYESEILDYIPIDEKKENLVNTYIKNSKFWNKNIITRLIYNCLQKNNIENMNIKFQEFREKMLNLTKKKYYGIEDLKKEKFDAEIYCTGSDQVWGKIGNMEFDPSYFLEFDNDGKKCISFSASFGKTNINEMELKELPLLLKKYSSILIRENSGLQIVKNMGFKNVNQVLDPTLILNKNNWEKILEPITENKKYIFIYQLHHNRFFDKYAKFISKKTNLKIIRVNPSKYFKYKPGIFKGLVSPGQFLNYIKNAEFILTDSFHGTAFSILFNKKFVDILPNETSTRIVSLLEFLNLKDRIIYNELNFNKLTKEIDYKGIEKILEEEQDIDIKLLEKALKEGNSNE